jgi:hypothetical protein
MAPMQARGEPLHPPPEQQSWPVAPQAAQEPDSQMPLAPHAVPSATLVPVSWQTETPVVQSTLPVWHAFDGVHDAPCVHALHVPAWQTWLLPQPVPSGRSPVETHDGVPEAQSMTPCLHGFEGVQALPPPSQLPESIGGPPDEPLALPSSPPASPPPEALPPFVPAPPESECAPPSSAQPEGPPSCAATSPLAHPAPCPTQSASATSAQVPTCGRTCFRANLLDAPSA